jgi:hypothetical protein
MSNDLFKKRLLLALKELLDGHLAKREGIYDQFRDVIMKNALKMDRVAYCLVLNSTLVELKFLKTETAGTKKKCLLDKMIMLVEEQLDLSKWIVQTGKREPSNRLQHRLFFPLVFAKISASLPDCQRKRLQLTD